MQTELLFFVIFIICDIIFYYSMHLFLLTAKTKSVNKKFLLLRCILSGLITELIYYSEVNTAIYIISSLTTIYFISVEYANSFARRVILSVFFLVFGAAIEFLSAIICVYVLSVPMSTVGESLSFYNCVGTVVSRILMFIIMSIFYVIYHRKTLFSKYPHNWILTVFYPISSIFLFYYLIDNSIKGNLTNYTILFIAIFLILLMNIIVFNYFDKLCQAQEIKEKYDSLLHYQDIQLLQQQRTDAYNRTIATMRHDMKNYLLSIANKIELGQIPEVLDEISSTNQQFLTPEKVISSPDSLLNYILNAKLFDCEQNNIDLIVTYKLSKLISMPIGELSILLGNAIDNAIEYLSGHDLEKKVIDLNIVYDYNTLYIAVKNPLEDDIIIPKNYNIPSTKKTEFHGLGIQSMQQIVENYEGLFTITSENHFFLLEITMPLINNN